MIMDLIYKALLIGLMGCSYGIAQDLGTYGELFPIAETNLVEVIERKLAKLEQNGSLKDYQAQVQSKVEAKLKRPAAVSSVVHTTKPKTFTFDPSITVTADLRDHKGNVFHHQGEVVNPLHYRSMTKPLLFIDGDELKHIEWALKVLKKYPLAKVILVKGEPLKLMDELGITIYFDQFGKITQKLGILQVPAIVTQDNNLLKIEEVLPDV